MGQIVAFGALTAIVGLALSATVAAAAEEPLTRGEYVPRLEQICEPRSEMTRDAIDGVRVDVRKGRLPLAAHKFRRAANIFGGTTARIARVPRPAADLNRLRKWFVYLKRQEAYLREIAAELRASHEIRAQRLLARFIHNGNKANQVTLAFGFEYCRFKFSRYGF